MVETRVAARTGIARRAPWVGLATAVALIALAIALPALLGWDVRVKVDSTGTVPPLHAEWKPKVGPGTIPAVVIALFAVRYAVSLAESLSWRRLLLGAYVGGLAWFVALAYVDGSSGISRVLGFRREYLPTARATDDVFALLSEYMSRIPVTAEDNWPTHIAGHPPGAVLFFVFLDRIGLGGNFVAGMVVVVLAATTSLAVMVALRTLGEESVARRAAPFIVFGPSAVWMAVSADALFTAIAAWGLCALALGARAARRRTAIAWSALAGLLLGSCVMMSYGLPLLGFLAVAILLVARSWLPLPIAAGVAAALVLAFAGAGFALWEALPVLQERYWWGIASERPAEYWMWGNLAALAIGAGPLLGAGIGRLAVQRERAVRAVVLLVGAAMIAIIVADLSQMSRAEVERIWLPFIPWLLLSVAVLPERWRRFGIGLQLAVAIAVQHLLFTFW